MRAPGSTFRRLVVLALAAGGSLASACGDNPILGPGEFQGTWSFTDPAGTVVLVITGDSIHEYDEDPIADCYEHTAYRILEIEGREFRLETVGDTLRVEIYRDGEDLIAVVGNGREVRYDDSNVDPATLPLCPPPSVTAACLDQDALTIDGAAEGTIAITDDENPDGTYYDLYRLEVATATELRIDMTSSFDSYLILFDSLGALVTLNDDASDRTLDARITRAFDPGCWIVMATTAFAGRFGDYEISVEVPD